MRKRRRRRKRRFYSLFLVELGRNTPRNLELNDDSN